MQQVTLLEYTGSRNSWEVLPGNVKHPAEAQTLSRSPSHLIIAASPVRTLGSISRCDSMSWQRLARSVVWLCKSMHQQHSPALVNQFWEVG